MSTRLSRYRDQEDGAVTIEATLWLPFLLFLFFGIGELALIFYGQSRTLEVAQDATRLISIGEIETASESENYINTKLSNISSNATSWNRVDQGLITTVITVPANDLAPFGFFTAFTDFEVTVVAQQVVEF